MTAGPTPYPRLSADEFDEYLQIVGGNKVAAAICYFADRVGSQLWDFDHQIACGIRMGTDELVCALRGLGD
jgi:hypothetical protein